MTKHPLAMAVTEALPFAMSEEHLDAFGGHVHAMEELGRLQVDNARELALAFGVSVGEADAVRYAAERISTLVRGMETAAAMGDSLLEPVAAWLLDPRTALPPRIGYYDTALSLEVWFAAAIAAKTALSGDSKSSAGRGGTETGAVSTGLLETKMDAPQAQQKDEDDGGVAATLPPSVAHSALLAQVGSVFREAWGGLQTRERLLLRMTVVDGLGLAGVASLYAVPASRVGRWLLQARERLARASSGRLRQLAVMQKLDRPEAFVPIVLQDFDFWLALHAAEELAHCRPAPAQAAEDLSASLATVSVLRDGFSSAGDR